uniref:Uncharacterized protein n=1 Tax=Cucumis melo TaxID=3656 RepID=A0A9I9E280_CUCME
TTFDHHRRRSRTSFGRATTGISIDLSAPPQTTFPPLMSITDFRAVDPHG